MRTRYQTAIIAHIYYDIVRLMRIRVQPLNIRYNITIVYYKYNIHSVTERTDKYNDPLFSISNNFYSHIIFF